MMFPSISGEESAFLKSLRLPPVSQIGIIVPDLARAARYYGLLLNIKRWYHPPIREAECAYRGKPVDQSLEIAVGYSGGIQIELIHQECSEENIYNALLGRGGGGLHHLGVSVGDIDRRMKLLTGAGLRPLQSGVIRFGRGGVTRYVYLDTREQAGFILELIETRAFGINLGMPEWVMRLGLLTGDTVPLKIPSQEQ